MPLIRATSIDIDQELRFDIATPANRDYLGILHQAYPFFRAHSGRRYTSSTLNRIYAAAQEVEEGEMYHLPHIVTIGSPITFDEETETKSGGLLAMYIGFSDKAILAVHPAVRQKGVGRYLVTQTRQRFGALPMWVGQSNIEAQIFLLKLSYVPTAMNSNGAIRYDYGDGARGDV